MKIYSAENSDRIRYPSWSVFTKLWKNTIFPVLKQNLTIESWEKPSTNEDYILSVKDLITSDLIFDLCVQVTDALTAKGFLVEQDGTEITILGKTTYSPLIEINIFQQEPDDDFIMYAMDDARWASTSQAFDDMTFNESYQRWLDERGLVDNAEEITKATRAVKKAYCDWVRSITNEIAITIIYAE